MLPLSGVWRWLRDCRTRTSESVQPPSLTSCSPGEGSGSEKGPRGEDGLLPRDRGSVSGSLTGLDGEHVLEVRVARRRSAGEDKELKVGKIGGV